MAASDPSLSFCATMNGVSNFQASKRMLNYYFYFMADTNADITIIHNFVKVH